MKSNILLLLLFLNCIIIAQSTISGKVVDENKEPLPGVTVRVLNTQNITITDFNGIYSINAQKSDTLEFSFIGYLPQNFVVGESKAINIQLKVASEQLEDVVVTALGITKEKKALGYSVSEIDVNKIAQAREINVVNSISGKVAGLQVSKTSGGPGSSSRIVIRGNSSIAGNNQALIVVDGVPIDNSTTGTGGTWGGIDYGSGISDINPDDIESMTVLKGPNAAALYGSRASNGVLVITTKKGRKGAGMGVTVNSTLTIDQPYIQRKFQDVYGAGTGGKFEYNDDGIPYFNTTMEANSWGPKMENQEYIDWDGVKRTYSPQPNNYNDYWRFGKTLTNSFSIDGGGDNSSYRLSYTNLMNEGFAPNSSFDRNTLNLRASSDLNTRLSVDAKVNYVRQEAFNRLNQSDGRGAPRNYHFMPRNISDASLSDYKDELGNEKVWYTGWAWQSNPYWIAYENQNADNRDRVIGFIDATYKINEWLNFQAKTGTDFFNERRRSILASGAFQNPEGEIEEVWLNMKERNSSFLFNANKQLSKQIGLSGNIGGNAMYRRSEFSSQRNNELSNPGFYHIEYGQNEIDAQYRLSEKKINSIYGSAQIDIKEQYFLDFTARNDWSSTLPNDNNSYFYPSVSASMILSDVLKIESKTLSFAKIRSSWARVGNDTDPYQLQLTYFSENPYNNNPRVGVNGTSPAPELMPEITTSIEFGTELKFFKNRLGLDITYYDATSRNQIVAADVSGASGFYRALINAGEMRNFGIEALLNYKLIDKTKFTWNTTLNFTRNNSLVVSLDKGLETLELGEQWNISVDAYPGQPYGVLRGTEIAKDANGNRIVDENGMYVRGEAKAILGNFNPDWMAGLSNSINYKNFNIGFLVDVRMGGEIYSGTNMYGMGYSGTFVETLEGREEWYASEKAREEAGKSSSEWDATGGVIAEGVYAEGTVINGEDVSGQPNTTYIDPERYWDQFSSWGNQIHEQHVYDASFVKLREFSIGYRLPDNLTEKMKVQLAVISLVGRNLWLIHKNVPNIDPESSYTNGNGQGLEYASYPTMRNIGFNLKLKI